MWEISRPAEELSASQTGLQCLELFVYLVSYFEKSLILVYVRAVCLCHY